MHASLGIRRVIKTSPSRVKSCSLEPVSTFIVCASVDLLLPYMTSMINASLVQGRLLLLQDIVTLLPKKTGFDPADMSNSRPVSNLSSMPNVIEWAVFSQLTEYLSANDALSCFQSAYRRGST